MKTSMTLAPLVLFLAVSGAGAGCGSDKASSPDGSSATLAQMCAAYCTCMVAVCSNVSGTNYTPGGDAGACQTMCLAQTHWDLSCRIEHCGNASSTGLPATHCPHAVGQNGQCADTP
jgi:hypothetical protein